MSLNNIRVSDALQNMADLMELLGENPFAVRAYRNATRIVKNLEEDVLELANNHFNFASIKGIGKDLAKQISDLATNRTSSKMEELISKVPKDIPELLKVPGLGPKKVQALWNSLKIESPQQLLDAAKGGKLEQLPGYGTKTVQKLISILEESLNKNREFLLPQVESIVTELLSIISDIPEVERIEVTGSYRQREDVISSIQFLACGTNLTSEIVGDSLTSLHLVSDVSVEQDSIRFTAFNGLIGEIILVASAAFGTYLWLTSSSKDHARNLLELFSQKGAEVQSLEEVLSDKNGSLHFQTEEAIQEFLDIDAIAPEIRLGLNELKDASEHSLPALIELKDIRGNLHTHTSESDGDLELNDLLNFAASKGLEYLGISDHSFGLRVANGLSVERLENQVRQINKLKETNGSIQVLAGIEIEILEDGSLEFEDSVLKELDFVIGAVHSKFNLPAETQTKRILRAIDNPYLTFLAHPTGRLLTRRPGYSFDLEKVLKHVRDRGCFIELNADPNRLDLNYQNCRRAKELGIKITINTDAHSKGDFDNLKYGIWQARRAGLGKGDVINTLDFESLKKVLKKIRLT